MFRLKKRLIVRVTVFYFLLLSVPGTVTAQSRGVQVRLGGQELFSTNPKNVVSTIFEITNSSTEEQEFISQIELPEGWKLLSPAFPFRLAPEESETKLVSIFVPRTARAGKYEITYPVWSVQDPSVRDITRIFVEVLSVTKLQAELLEAPEHVIAGDTYEARFTVANESNIENRVNIQVTGTPDLPYTVDPAGIILAPGESKTVKIVVETDKKTRKVFNHNLRLTVQSSANENLRGMARCSVKILPRTSGKEDRFRRIPASVVISGLIRKTEKRDTGFHGEFSGKGALDEKGEKQIEFLFRGPDTLEEFSRFGVYDQYFVGYRTKNLNLRAGDYHYSLSQLTERSVLGRGIGGELNKGAFGLSAYHIKTRRLSPEKKETSLHLDYQAGDKYKFGVNLFNKKSALSNNRIASLQGKIEPFTKSSIEFETAYGKNDHGSDSAHWLNLYSSPFWGGTYRVEYMYAEPDFPGYYRDKKYFSGSFFFPLKKNLTVNASFRQEKNNLDLDTSQNSAALNRFGQLGLNYRFKTGTSVSVTSRYHAREDLLPDPGFNYREPSFRARLTHNFNKLYVNISAEKGKVTDRLAGLYSDRNFYEASCYFMPLRNQTYGGYVRYDRRRDPFNGITNTIINTGMTGSLHIAEKTRVRFRLEKFDSTETDSRDRHIIDLGLSHRIRSKSTISAHGRHTSYNIESGRNNDTALIVSFTVPFGLPVGRKKGIAALRGTVHDQETGQPIPNLILRLNNATAVTDNDGNFSFPALKPGTFYLDVDSTGIGLNRISVQKTPLEINISDGEKTNVEIMITKSASLEGRIMVYQFAEKDNLAEKYLNPEIQDDSERKTTGSQMLESHGLKNALLEFRSEREILRVLTSRKGQFSFDDVRPGKWTLTVHATNLPQYSYLERDTFEIELSPGEKKEMHIKVLPKKRTIQIIEEGQILTEEEG
jgi:Carboxypeptidase regulatory-like domain